MVLYEEQRDEGNILIGYIRKPDGACIPLDTRNKDYRKILDWISQGNIPDSDNTLLRRLIDLKVAEYKKEGVLRIQSHVSSWDSIDIVGLIASTWNMLGPPNAAQSSAKDIYVYVVNTAIPFVKTRPNVAAVQAIDVVNDPNFPS